jgi:hypothetical protein
MRRTLLLLITLALPAATAQAAGGPVPPVQGGAGATAPGSELSYIAVPAGGNTVLAQLHRPAGEVWRTRVLRGHWGVPGVSYDGATTGLSADGRTLVLAEQRSAGTRLRVLDAHTLRVRQRIGFRGLSVVDAVSPRGRWVYLIRYHGAGYEVRAYDLRRHRLTPKPIVDPREPDEQMQGVPLSRVMSRGGRWAYTLYAGDEPFVHALDTRGRTARCIDLEGLTMDDVADAKLTLEGRTLQVGTVAMVNTRTFAVLSPRAPVAATRSTSTSTAAPERAQPDGDGTPWWPFAAAALAALAAAAWWLARRARPRRAVFRRA